MDYIAEKGNTRIILSKTEQMDKLLDKGFNIYRDKNGKEELVASPEKGFVGEKPIIEQYGSADFTK